MKMSAEEQLHFEHIVRENRRNEMMGIGPGKERDRPFTVTEVRRAVLKLQNGKSAGIDGLVYESLQN